MHPLARLGGAVSHLRIWTAFAVLLTSGLVHVIGSDSPASAHSPNVDEPSQGTSVVIFLRHRKSGLCLAGNDRGVVFTDYCADDPRQDWNHPGPGPFTHQSTGLCVDGHNAQTQVNLLECNGGSSQFWYGYGATDGNVLIGNGGLCFAAKESSSYVYTAPCDKGSYYQQWKWIA